MSETTSEKSGLPETRRQSWLPWLVSLRGLIVLWLAWAVLLMGYQAYVQARFRPQPPDYALSWIPSQTLPDSQDGKPYLLEPYLNDHVAWDSEYYLSIAVGGYDDPQMRAIPADYTWNNPQVALKSDEPSWISMNYAFFPLYPIAMHVVAVPLGIFGLNPIATATLAGVIVSALGTLGAMLALYDLTSALFGPSVARRAAFYLLIFPTAFFLLQVYTEGLFIGLSFGTLALARRQNWLWAALLAACATWTRPAGAFLLLPLIWYWWENGGWGRLTQKFSLVELGKVILLFSPALAILVWQLTLGAPFQSIESHFFSRQALAFGPSFTVWQQAWQTLFQINPQMTAYYLVEFAAIALALIACAFLWRRSKVLALYSLATIIFSATTGVAMGMHRYVLAAPAIFIIPAVWGENEAFDRAWTIGNVLLMGVFATMFTFNFWAG